jgi:hypothetical protein
VDKINSKFWFIFIGFFFFYLGILVLSWKLPLRRLIQLTLIVFQSDYFGDGMGPGCVLDLLILIRRLNTQIRIGERTGDPNILPQISTPKKTPSDWYKNIYLKTSTKKLPFIRLSYFFVVMTGFLFMDGNWFYFYILCTFSSLISKIFNGFFGLLWNTRGLP